MVDTDLSRDVFVLYTWNIYVYSRNTSTSGILVFQYIRNTCCGYSMYNSHVSTFIYSTCWCGTLMETFGKVLYLSSFKDLSRDERSRN